MPTNQAVWGIEIGQCALKAIRLRHDPETNKVEALAFDYIEHSKILSQPDADPDALSREALSSFLSRNQVKGDRVVIGVPGQSGLARFIKLPPVEPSRIPEIVKYEARQQIPFALEEVVWDYQTIGKSEEAGGFALETEIGLFAMKRDLIYRFMNPFREAAVEVDIVQMRPLAVYNFAAFDQLAPKTDGDGQEAKEEEGEPKREELVEEEKPAAEAEGGFVVLLDMGADNSDLVITDGMRIWQRNLPIGGNHFTRALTKELKLTFAKAEHLKRNATKAQDPRAIFQAMRPVFNDLVSEIQRSIGYFSSVHRQSKITKIIGMGNAFKLPGLQKFLAQNLQYQVEKVEGFMRLKGGHVVSAPAFQENILSFSVVYGLALQGLEMAGVRTSLLPPEISQARMIRRKKPWALSAAAILMAAFTCLFFGNWAQLHAVNSPAFKDPELKADAAKKLKTEKEQAYQKVKQEWGTIKGNGETLTANVEKRLEWIEVLAAISRALPSNPANIEQKRKAGKEHIHPSELGEVQITSIGVTYYDDVKAGWFDRVMSDPADWPKKTVLPLDEKEPPSGLGWVFSLEGYHFNKAARTYTYHALLDTPNGFAQAAARTVGIRGAVVVENRYQSNWIPTADQRTASRTRRGSRPSGGGASAPSYGGGAGGGAGAGRMAGMAGGGMGMGGETGDSSSGAGGTSAAPGMAGGGRELPGDAGMMGMRGGGGTPPMAGTAPITTLPRTDFVLEFVWQPVEPSKRKTAEQWLADIQKYGERGAVLEPPAQPPQQPTGGGQPGAPPAGAPPQPGAPPPGGPPAGGQPGQSQPPTSPPMGGQTPGGPPGQGQPPAGQPPAR